MDGGHRSVMAGVHRLQHLQHLGATHLADHDAVGAHAQAVAHQVADADRPLALGATDAALQAHHMRVVERELGGVFHGDDAFVGRHVAGQRIEQRGLARAGAAGDQDVAAAQHHRLQQRLHRCIEGALGQQLVGGEGVLAELADGHHRPVHRQWRDDRVEAATIGQACIDHRIGIIQAAAERGDDAAQDAQQVGVIGEALWRAFELPALGDMHILEAIDQDVFDGGVMQQVIERAEPGQLLDQAFGHHLHFFFIDGDAPFLDETDRLHLHPAGDGVRGPGIDVDALVFDAVEQVLVGSDQDLLVLLGLGERGRRGIHRGGGLAARMQGSERGHFVFHGRPPRRRTSFSRQPRGRARARAGSSRASRGVRARR
ncbi:hypothetical protein D3C72_1295640 [compost metagenome]